MKLAYIYIAVVLFGFVIKTVNAQTMKLNNLNEMSDKINRAFELPDKQRPVLFQMEVNYDFRIDLIKGKKLCQLLLQNENASFNYGSAGIRVRTKDGKDYRPEKVYVITHSSTAKEAKGQSRHKGRDYQVNGQNIFLKGNGSFRVVESRVIGKTEFKLLEGEWQTRHSGVSPLFIDALSCDVKKESWSFF